MSAASNRPLVLVVEDEPSLATVLVDNLEAEGCRVRTARDGATGAAMWRGRAGDGAEEGERPDLVVLDVMLPTVDGLELCRSMREAGDQTPVLFLSARGLAEDRVRGLAAGGDDYLAKPFHLPEFLLRVRAMLRRRGWGDDAARRIAFAGHVVDFRSWTATLADGRTEALGERELGIFRLLSQRSGEVVSRDDILDAVWGDDAFPSSRTIDNVVLRLRRLFERDPAEPEHIHTVWGVGYRFTPEPERAGDPTGAADAAREETT